MKKNNTLFRLVPEILILALIAVLAVGCKVKEKGTPLENQAPTVSITYGPLNNSTVNHYVELRWAGNDADGTVTGYQVYVDGTQIAFTSATDTTLAFSSPVDSGSAEHSFGVIAVDDEGAVSSMSSRTFRTVNYSPSVEFSPSSVPEGATVSSGFRVTLAATDPNPSLFYYSVSTDNETWTPWVTDSVFVFADPTLHAKDNDETVVDVDDDSDGAVDEETENGDDDDHDGRIDEDTRGLYPPASFVISTRNWQSGPVTIYGRVKDAGDAESAVIVRQIEVNTALRASMDSTVSGLYGTAEFYPDGSVYYARQQDIETSIAFSASFDPADVGVINAYRYQFGDSAWSDWFTSPSVVFEGLAPGIHTLRFMARDLAGNTTTDTLVHQIRLVEQQLTRNVVIVDETADQGLTPEEEVDAFYEYLFRDYSFTTVEYLERGEYLTPYDLSNAGLVMYHADDRTQLRLQNNVTILSQYMSRGGRVMLSGYDLMGPFTDSPQDDSLLFPAGSFGRDYLQLISTNRTPATPRIATGFSGVEPFTTCNVDSEKTPSSFNDALDRIWVFQPLGHTRPIGRLLVKDPDDPTQDRWEGRINAYLYDQSFRIAVFGFPLYFTEQEDAALLFDQLIPIMLEGIETP